MDGRRNASQRTDEQQQKRRILAIDGGGIKGAYPAAFLATIEDATGRPIAEHFDLIAGTSTGGIIALGLGLGIPAREILNFYFAHGPAVFSQPQESSRSLFGRLTSFLRRSRRNTRQLFGPAYDAVALRTALVHVFGDRLLGESAVRLVIPAYNSGTRSVYVFKTAHHPRFELDRKRTAVDVALATTAAPTFFPAHTLPDGASLVDGGIWANNPAGVATVEALGVLGWPAQSLHVLSLGCTEPLFVCPPKAGALDLLLAVQTLFLQGQSAASLGTAKLLSGHTESTQRVFRYSLQVDNNRFTLDDVSAVKELVGYGATAARDALPVVREIFLADKVLPFVPEFAATAR